jgi:nucleoside-diphosphate-sugar epimerase
MRVMVTGNMGYVGPAVVKRLRSRYPGCQIIGYDTGYFASRLSNAFLFPECRADMQYYADIRDFPPEILQGVDAIIHLAAISNDPMGNLFEGVTSDINFKASVALARKARRAGVKSFVFASSCSVYGVCSQSASEQSAVNPLTAYAKSKVRAEEALKQIADDDFQVTCLRFATACGMSERLRLDLVLNDFVASAVSSGQILILSDGTPWRPLIHINDMAGAIEWAVRRRSSSSRHKFLVVNVGSDSWNYRVKELADAVKKIMPHTEVRINPNAQPDKRSYRVDFGLFKELAPGFQPAMDLPGAIAEMKQGLAAMGFKDADFRNTHFMRLKVLHSLIDQGLIDKNLKWTFRKGSR